MTGKESSVVQRSGEIESLTPNLVAKSFVREGRKVGGVEGMAARDILSQGDCLPGKLRIQHRGRPTVGLGEIGSSITDSQQSTICLFRNAIFDGAKATVPLLGDDAV